MKRFFALLLAVLMTLCLAAPVFADDEEPTAPTYSITVSNTNDSVSIVGNTYSAYKLFDVVYKDTAYAYTISTSSPFYTNAKTVLADYFTLTQSIGDATVFTVEPKEGFDEAKARELADKLNAYLASATPVTSEKATEESVVITLTEPGYYLVAGQVDAIHAGQTGNAPKVTSAIAITNADPAGEINVKADAPDVDKVIVNADSASGKDGYGTAVNVGDTVTFKETSKVPVTTGYTKYTLIFNDTYTSGLDTPTNFAVKIGDTTLGASDYTVDTATSGKFTLTIADLLAKDEEGKRLYADGADIVITYDAVLNKNALTTDVEKNTVNLTYSSNPYNTEETKTTPDHVVYVFDFEIDIDKFAKTGETTTDKEDATTPLAGAEFVLYKTVENVKNYAKIDDTTKAVTWYALGENETVKAAVEAGKITKVITTELGAASFAGLDAGDYALTEIAAPEGYNLLTSDVTVSITAEYNEDGTLKTSSAASDNKGEYKQTSSIENKAGTVLPETGGVGTVLLISISAIVFVTVMVVLVAKKRLYNEAE